MFWTAGPALGISLVIFLVLGLTAEPRAREHRRRRSDVLESEFNISAVNLLPLALLVVFTLRKVPPFLAILGSALFAGVLACFTQWTVVKAFVDEPGLGPGRDRNQGRSTARWRPAYVSKSGIPAIDQLFSRGGMASLLTTVWLVLGALSFAAILEHAGFLERLLLPVVAHARTPRTADPRRERERHRAQRRSPATSTSRTCSRAACSAAEFERRGLAPRGALARGRGLGHRHLAARAVEHLRRVHVRRPRRADGLVPAVLLLQLSEPGARRAVRVHRLQGAVAARGERGGGASGRAGGDVTRAVAWIRARDPGFTALRRAARGAVVVPAMFAVGDKLIGNPTIALFAGFGSFALLLLVEFSGPMLDRARSQVALVVAGAALVCLGSLASRSTWLATLAMAVAGFCVLFAGVVSSVFAAATVSMLLSFILAVSIRVPASAIPDRLAGWALAGAASLPAILFLWPAPVTDRLRDAAGAACRAHGRRLRAEAEYPCRRHGRYARRA